MTAAICRPPRAVVPAPSDTLLALAALLSDDAKAALLDLTGTAPWQPTSWRDTAACHTLHRLVLAGHHPDWVGWYAEPLGFQVADALRWRGRTTILARAA